MTDHTHGSDTDRRPEEETEARDVRLRPLLVFTVGLAVTLIAVYLVVVVMFRLFSREAAQRDTAAGVSQAQPLESGEERLPPAPRIQTDPAADLTRFRRQEDAVLNSYGWVDRQAGTVRVPIEVAMKLVLEQGLPVRQPAGAPPAPGTPAPPAPPPTGERKSP